MSLSSPNLDDRDFNHLLEECRLQIRRSCPDWTDLSPGDPGMMLLELFAHLTEIMVYRLNRLPDKAYVEFLRLLGVRILPPAAASASLTFTLARPQEQPIEIPRGTRVTIARATGGIEPPVFVTARTTVIEKGQTEVTVQAHHCELVEAELAGKATGLPGLSVTAQRPPIVAPLSGDLDLIVGVEAAPAELDERAPAVKHDGKAFRIWREVENFTDLGPDDFAYVVDRTTGTITFAPAIYRQAKNDQQLEGQVSALAAIPPAGRDIRLWYRRGGGPSGNVAANTLTTLKDPLAGVQVNNPEPAAGGRAAETLENALVPWPPGTPFARAGGDRARFRADRPPQLRRGGAGARFYCGRALEARPAGHRGSAARPDGAGRQYRRGTHHLAAIGGAANRGDQATHSKPARRAQTDEHYLSGRLDSLQNCPRESTRRRAWGGGPLSREDQSPPAIV